MFSQQSSDGKMDKDSSGGIDYLKSSLDLLLAAGYFRIRIKSLSTFDKIIGGLVFCIANASYDVDIDELAFTEQPNLGQKLRIAERVISALKRMKCPFVLQPFQITKLNEIKPLYEVLQWLLQKVYETREENMERIRRYSGLLCERNAFLTDFDAELKETFKSSKSYLGGVNDQYVPKRKFRRKNISLAGINEWGHVQGVMLEYGRDFNIVKTEGTKEAVENDISVARRKLEMQNSEQKSSKDEDDAEKVKENFKKGLEEDAGQISKEILGNLMKQGASDISKARDQHEKESEELERLKLEQGQSDEYIHRRKVTTLKKQIQVLQEKFTTLKGQREVLVEELKDLKEEFEKYSGFNAQVTKKLDEMEQGIENSAQTEEDRVLIARLFKLVNLNESLIQQESLFRKQCEQQVRELKQKIEQLQAERNSDKFSKLTEISSKLEEDKKKLSNVRSVAAKRNREIALLQRKIDEIPVRSELNQYEKRFSELYDQMLTGLNETKGVYGQYNTLSESYTFLEKELNLLEQIHEYFQKAKSTKSKEYRNWMDTTVSKLLQAVTKSLEAVNAKMEKEDLKKSEKNDEYGTLIGMQREYFRKVKLLQVEAKKNSQLGEKVQNLKRELTPLMKQYQEMKETKN